MTRSQARERAEELIGHGFWIEEPELNNVPNFRIGRWVTRSDGSGFDHELLGYGDSWEHAFESYRTHEAAS